MPARRERRPRRRQVAEARVDDVVAHAVGRADHVLRRAGPAARRRIPAISPRVARARSPAPPGCAPRRPSARPRRRRGRKSQSTVLQPPAGEEHRGVELVDPHPAIRSTRGDRARSSRSGGWRPARRRCRRGSTRRTGSGRASAGRPGTSRARRRPAGGRPRRAGRSREPPAISSATSHRFSMSPGAGRALDLEVVAVVAVQVEQRAQDHEVHREPDRPAPVRVAAEHAAVGLGRQVADLVVLAVPVELVRVRRGGSARASGCRAGRGTRPRRA